ncbi:MAG: hypothetical protein ACD_18C00064G0003 [uncultured bacterium]|nr:MAG: hypothetical protein ACD_18C00064G0003 [uncultured bacterium]OGH83599.1 MAG: hypothetical protein A2488_03505 [Candidatus Magasanikbacteria bacterium RIFOXYC12_FULL_32_21b]OGH90655.1 MAG: hypothetical protein A2507_01840 [Candidatus Magasanikbacteria bacterium RIFOXYD12_FULL_33_17]HAO52313.1 hypothetical protein [Candidatus Magasanikbacteria bacterium]
MKIKKILIITGIILGLLVVNIAVSHAAGTSIEDAMAAQNQAFAGKTAANLGSPKDVRIIVTNIIRIFLSFVGLLATAYLFYGGYLYMTSAGNESRTSSASKIMLSSALGLLVVLTSYSITMLIYKIYLSSITPATGLGELLKTGFGSLFGSLF